jgi:hypothetical protein
LVLRLFRPLNLALQAPALIRWQPFGRKLDPAAAKNRLMATLGLSELPKTDHWMFRQPAYVVAIGWAT